jgi:hypothetical protein
MQSRFVASSSAVERESRNEEKFSRTRRYAVRVRSERP